MSRRTTAAVTGAPPVASRRSVAGQRARGRRGVEGGRHGVPDGGGALGGGAGEGRAVGAERRERPGRPGHQHRQPEHHLVGVHDVVGTQAEAREQRVQPGGQGRPRVGDGPRRGGGAGGEHHQRAGVRVGRRRVVGRRAAQQPGPPHGTGRDAGQPPARHHHVPQPGRPQVGQGQAAPRGQATQRAGRREVHDGLGHRPPRLRRGEPCRRERLSRTGIRDHDHATGRDHRQGGHDRRRAGSHGEQHAVARFHPVAAQRRGAAAHLVGQGAVGEHAVVGADRRHPVRHVVAVPEDGLDDVGGRHAAVPAAQHEPTVRRDQHVRGRLALHHADRPGRLVRVEDGAGEGVELGGGQRGAEAEVRSGAEPQVPGGGGAGALGAEPVGQPGGPPGGHQHPVAGPHLAPGRGDRRRWPGAASRATAWRGAAPRRGTARSRDRSAATSSSRPASCSIATARGAALVSVSVPVSSRTAASDGACDREMPSAGRRPSTLRAPSARS